MDSTDVFVISIRIPRFLRLLSKFVNWSTHVSYAIPSRFAKRRVMLQWLEIIIDNFPFGSFGEKLWAKMSESNSTENSVRAGSGATFSLDSDDTSYGISSIQTDYCSLEPRKPLKVLG